ncbi:hypothetical protein BC828DRAFT_61423 [Blastocladiella britannica]|nr:hypothetical protein BC828DRAFT_61423 [Blastocladiella britannica]
MLTRPHPLQGFPKLRCNFFFSSAMPSLSQRALGRSSPSGSSPHNTYQMTSQHPPVAPAAALPSTAGQQPLSPRSTMTGGGSATVHIPPTALPLDSSAITGSKLPFRERAKAFIRPYLKLWRNMHDIRLTAYSVLWFLFCTYVTCLSNSTVDRINPNSILPVDQRHALQDPLLQWSFKIFDKTGLPMDFADILVRIATALIFARCFTLKDKSFTVFRRTMYISGAVYLFRAPTVLLTVLPNPYLTVTIYTLFFLANICHDSHLPEM